MHKSESQFRLINTYMDEEVVDPLNYAQVAFQKQEWDNIPMVIPRFCLHLEKQMNALSSHYRDRCEQEPDPAARAKMVDDLRTGLRDQNSHHTHLAKEVTDILSKLNSMKDTVHHFTDQINNDREHQKEKANAPLGLLVLEDERDVAKVKYEAPEFLALSPFRFQDIPST